LELKPTITKRAASAGFSLIEMLLSLAILAFGASIVSLNAPQRRSEALDDAERLAARLQMAVESATLSGSALRMDINSDAYQFYRFENGRWQEADPQSLSGRRFASSAKINFEAADAFSENERILNGVIEERSDLYQIIIDPIGPMTPMSVAFGDGAPVSVSLDEIGNVAIERRAK